MAAQTKTKALLRLDVPLCQLVKNDENPNKMSQREFDLLVDNVQQMGMTDAILVRPVVEGKGGPKYRIVGGHHRFDVATYLGFETVPITVITDPSFDDDRELHRFAGRRSGGNARISSVAERRRARAYFGRPRNDRHPFNKSQRPDHCARHGRWRHIRANSRRLVRIHPDPRVHLPK